METGLLGLCAGAIAVRAAFSVWYAGRDLPQTGGRGGFLRSLR